MTKQSIQHQSWSSWILALLIIAIAGGVLFWQWHDIRTPLQPSRPADTTASYGATQTNEDEEVTITATWQKEEEELAFRITMDTHVVDLDGYNLQQVAVLHIDGGPEVHASRWEAAPGSHHRSETLIFPAATDGRSLIGAQTEMIELIIRNVGEVPERILRWTH